MEENLNSLYSNLERRDNVYPEALEDAAELYKLNYCKARKNGNRSRNKKMGDKEKEDNNKNIQATEAYFEVKKVIKMKLKRSTKLKRSKTTQF